MNFRDKQQYKQHYDLVEKHISTYFKGADITVFHDIPTLFAPLDIFYIQPKDTEFKILMTSGMSSIAMDVSDISKDANQYRFAEFITLIPKSMEAANMCSSNAKYDWIISMLKQSAKFPHYDDTWVGVGHTMQADEEMNPYSDDTDFCGCLVLPPMTFPETFQTINSPVGIINIYGLFPLFKEELVLINRNGFNEFIQLLIKNNSSMVINCRRRNYCKKHHFAIHID